MMPKSDNLFRWVQEPRLQTILAALNGEGKAMLVGGCVRDSLSGQSPFDHHDIDIDIATDRTPEEMKAIFTDNGIRWIATGEGHGTITARFEGLSAECTTLRSDVETDGRHAQVQFTRDWQQDWRRRDFTVNALYATHAGQVWDPVGGQADLEAGRVRFIGDAEQRIREDALRILRFFRFSSRFADELDATALGAIRAQAELLDILSKERVQSELFKTLCTKKASWVLAAAYEAGALGRLIPGSPDLVAFSALREMGVVDVSALLLALWPDIGGDRLRELLKASNSVVQRHTAIRQAGEAVANGASAVELLYHYSDGLALLGAQWVVAQGRTVAEERLHQLAHDAQPVLPISGKHLIAKGLKPGPSVSSALTEFEALWLQAGAPTAEDAVERLIGEALSRQALR